jgi:hypothetical protein
MVKVIKTKNQFTFVFVTKVHKSKKLLLSSACQEFITMTRYLLMPAMLLLLGNNAKISLPSTKNPLECTINSTNFWKVCETHFLLVEFLTIFVLQTEQHKLDLNDFTEALLKVMSFMNTLSL